MPSRSADIEYHTAIIVGGGPGGLGLAPLLGGVYPYYRPSPLYARRYPIWSERLARFDTTMYGLNFRAMVEEGLKPVDFFRSLHHPTSRFQGSDDLAMQFRSGPGIDFLLLSREDVGGIWINAPDELLALSPGHWMEFAYYPLRQFAEETGRSIDENALISRRELVTYYQMISERFGIADRVRTGVNVEQIAGCDEGFLLSTRDVSSGTVTCYLCKYLIYAAGQRAVLRRLDVPGSDLPFVTNVYRRPDDFPGQRVVVVGGGRSADWAATELYEAGRTVHYVMRQGFDVHWRLIEDSRRDLPYYARLAEIVESGDARLERRYETRIECIERRGDRGVVIVSRHGTREEIEVDHVVVEIGGVPDYSLFQCLPSLRLVPLRDRYR
ncbi:MAG TPA: NAD(P)-binding domain-containing protein, partial [Chloroflexota bacterium]|nr:NAD(P)-binding domain-containing protein [Chloroflexota bacterium]